MRQGKLWLGSGTPAPSAERLARLRPQPREVRGLTFLAEAEPSARINRDPMTENCIGLEAARW
jgi:hypothetical protein